MYTLKHTRGNISNSVLVLMSPKLKLCQLPARHRCVRDEQVRGIKCYCGEHIIFVHYAYTLGQISTSAIYLLKIQIDASKFY